jgi:hypothetical protein
MCFIPFTRHSLNGDVSVLHILYEFYEDVEWSVCHFHDGSLLTFASRCIKIDVLNVLEFVNKH